MKSPLPGIETAPELNSNTPPVTSNVLPAAISMVAPAGDVAPPPNCSVPLSMSTVEVPDKVTGTPMVLVPDVVVFQIVPLLMMELAAPPPLEKSCRHW